MDTLFYYTGMLTWAIIGVGAVVLLFEIAVGFANAVSWARWSYRSAKIQGTQLRWSKFPSSFMWQWFEFIGYRNRGSLTITRTDGGTWHGIGDWTIAPKRVNPPYPVPEKLSQ